MKKYFNFKLNTLCGIPEIKVLGTREDWVSIKARLETLKQSLTDLSKWFDDLDGILEKFIELYDNKTDEDFWSKIYKSNI